MSNMRGICLWFVINLCLVSIGQSIHNRTRESLDASLQDFALRTLARHRPRTGALYKSTLPSNLSGLQVSILRLRSRRLWNIGANFSNFHIPSRTITMPHARRFVLVYQDLGNWSSQYYNVPGYSLATSVVGFMVYDASNIKSKRLTKLNLNTMGRPIEIRFRNLSRISGARCVAFENNGSFYMSQIRLFNLCHARNHGHFSVVVPLKRKKSLWYLWVIGFALGFGVLVLVGYFGMASLKNFKTKKIQVMERQADEDLVLQTMWIGNSKIPSAAVTRTQPVLENGGFA
ncbi:hypothetical protein HS088_TW16G00660 [Tripterygium wilfordii]|uniref:Uncharacterized protein n=1 Tax=Tripterygium wilfordii TaxID=458696 RepID=A0A7J7CJG6_TRIWF|nr:hypothetical protein HS088_TW16G00660 [Tripterygium wilfordii]